MSEDSYIDRLVTRYRNRSAVVAIVGLGYVGLPLATALINAGFKVVGFDIDAEKIAALKDGRTYIRHLPANLFSGAINQGRFHPTTDISQLIEADAILICVPTPLTSHREPDLTFIVTTAQAITRSLTKGSACCLGVYDLSRYDPRCYQANFGEVEFGKWKGFLHRLQPRA